MSKITNEQSREIYELATSPNREMSNIAIGKKFGITERAVRFHIKKWEKELHTISKTNAKVANALANHTLDVHGEAREILEQVRGSIQEAKSNGISPERLAPLYSNWIKSLELASELLGDIDRAPDVQVNVVYEEFNQLKTVVLSEVCNVCKMRLQERLHEIVSK
jgi:DNA-binding CsgD family transcriptional regulator